MCFHGNLVFLIFLDQIAAHCGGTNHQIPWVHPGRKRRIVIVLDDEDLQMPAETIFVHN
jgi:hypothetical protein